MAKKKSSSEDNRIVSKEQNNELQAKFITLVNPSSFRRDRNDPGIGKLTDLIIYARNRIVQIYPLTETRSKYPLTRGAYPYKSMSWLSGEGLYIDWSWVEKMLQINIENEYIQDSTKGNTVIIENVIAREFKVAREVHEKVKTNESLKREFENYKELQEGTIVRVFNQPWLDDYVDTRAEFMARNDEWRKTNYKDIWKMLQWLFDMQIRKVLQKMHENNGEAYFWYNVRKIDIETIETLDHWFDFGFDGGRLNIEIDFGIKSSNLDYINTGLGKKYENVTIYISVYIFKSASVLYGEKWDIVQNRVLRDAQEAVSQYNARKTADSVNFVLVRKYDALDRGETVDQGTLIEMSPEFTHNKTFEEIAAITKEVGSMQVIMHDKILSGSKDLKNRVPVKGSMKSFKAYDMGRREGKNFGQIPKILNENWHVLQHISGIEDEHLFYETSPGWSGLMNKYQYLMRAKTLGKIIEKNGIVYLFHFVYEVLSNTPGLTVDEWKSGWFHVKNIEKRASLRSLSLDRKIFYINKLFGFFSGIDEKMLEMHHADSKAEVLSYSRVDLKVKWLLDEILDSLKFGDKNEEYKIPEALLEKKKSVVSIAEAGSLDALPNNYKAILDQEYFESKNTIERILYIKALLNVAELKKENILGFSEQEEAYELLDKEIEAIRDLINQIFATLVRNRTIPELFFGEHMHFNRDAHIWAISGLMEIFDEERKISEK